jgi:hypothetical protein
MSGEPSVTLKKMSQVMLVADRQKAIARAFDDLESLGVYLGVELDTVVARLEKVGESYSSDEERRDANEVTRRASAARNESGSVGAYLSEATVARQKVDIALKSDEFAREKTLAAFLKALDERDALQAKTAARLLEDDAELAREIAKLTKRLSEDLSDEIDDLASGN